jgi:hypothetical protein
VGREFVCGTMIGRPQPLRKLYVGIRNQRWGLVLL